MLTSPADTSAAVHCPNAHLFGVSAAMVTPFAADGSVDLERLVALARDIVAGGAQGVTLFGTTGEGASIGPSERRAMLEAVVGRAVEPSQVTVCIAASDMETAVAQAREAFGFGVRRLLLAPPYYFKGVDDDALFAWVSDFIRLTADAAPQIIIYHIPQVTGIRFDAAIIRLLKQAFPEEIFGVKDSEGSWDHAQEMLAIDGLAVLIGDERLLARAAPLGGAGAISGMANLLPARISALVHQGQQDPALDDLVTDIITVPVTPLIKALVGATRNDDGWHATRPPLTPANAAIVEALQGRVNLLKA
ncbi:dihydrodipicolinate synthase family protein [Amaricoccus tamworthensis]|uniref:dihydrodipicolinate synthase family protein n=1 Tax=Amaricoccus tamworthensis TaxID=57002 RepID=UPI003C798546